MIFLSDRWQDHAVAREVDRQLGLAGFEVWVDRRNLRADLDILDQLHVAIRHCTGLVTVWPEKRNESPWTRLELSIARAYGKPVVPFIGQPLAVVHWIRTIASVRPTVELGCSMSDSRLRQVNGGLHAP